MIYALAGGVAAATAGPWLVLILVAGGLAEVTARAIGLHRPDGRAAKISPLAGVPGVAVGGLGAAAWVAFKVGALSHGGGFVIIPLMQHDAVRTYHWMSPAQFLSAVAPGQITPAPWCRPWPWSATPPGGSAPGGWRRCASSARRSLS